MVTITPTPSPSNTFDNVYGILRIVPDTTFVDPYENPCSQLGIEPKLKIYSNETKMSVWCENHQKIQILRWFGIIWVKRKE